ncbi:MAG: protease modulator HflK [Acidobacteriota bacterium]
MAPEEKAPEEPTPSSAEQSAAAQSEAGQSEIERPPQLPPSVRIIRGGRDWLWRKRRELVLGALAVALGWWLVTGVTTVDSGESAALLRFGAVVDDALGPGLHLVLPRGLDRVERFATAGVQRTDVEGDFTPKLSLVTADENLIHVSLSVQFRVHRLGQYLYSTEGPEELLQQTVRAGLTEVLATKTVDDVLTVAKAEVQSEVRRLAQQRLDAYEAGVTVVAVSLQSVEPPFEAAGAFRAVSDARAEAARWVNEAEALSARQLRLTRGQAQQLVEEASAAADSRVEEARGAGERFEQLLSRHRVSPRQVEVELWTEALPRVLSKPRLVLLPPGSRSVDWNLLPPEEKQNKAPVLMPTPRPAGGHDDF